MMRVEAEHAHALLSASASHRWLSCPPSARLEEQFPEESNEYAQEGSFAHKLAELILNKELGRMKKKEYEKRMAELCEDPYYSTEMFEPIGNYVTLALERINEAKARTKDAVILVEQRLDYSSWVPDAYGTGDLTIIADGIVEVDDLKYGKGILVSAKNNSQLKLYALGLLNEFELFYDIHTVRMTIVQPRLDNISTAEISVEELLAWGESIKPIAVRAFAGEGEFAIGEHCRFCRARSTCRERARANLELAKMDFSGPILKR